jgi:GTP-binding protein Era
MPRCGRVALAGRPNVGKSSLLNALVGEPLAIVSAKAQATRLPIIGLKTEGGVQFVLEDLPGLLDPAYELHERMRDLARRAILRADVVLYLHPAVEAPAPDFLEVAGLTAPPRAPVIPVYTMADRLHPERRAGFAPGELVVSAHSGEGLRRLTALVAARLPEAPLAYPEDDLGTQPTRLFVAEYLREAAFEHLDDELPYAVAAEVEEFRETGEPVYIRATLFVERESQRGIVLGKGGRTIKAIGQHARQRTEGLLGRRVFLETWVKVLPRWRRSPEQLARFGFPERDRGDAR